MTTDTFPKAAVRTAVIGEATVTIAGIAKGSGMIAPDMATMLSFVATDAKIPAEALQALLSRGRPKTFNCITVDSDTSTSDTRAALRHRPGEAPAGADGGRRDAEGLRPGAGRGAARPGPAWSRATARARRS